MDDSEEGSDEKNQHIPKFWRVIVGNIRGITQVILAASILAGAIATVYSKLTSSLAAADQSNPPKTSSATSSGDPCSANWLDRTLKCALDKKND